jgi:hypothetical protein
LPSGPAVGLWGRRCTVNDSPTELCKGITMADPSVRVPRAAATFGSIARDRSTSASWVSRLWYAEGGQYWLDGGCWFV